ncbi:MAG: hypothetical protein BMS9Abin29_0669 [Gemmatimonadota bacterium]|nr:MAG: hypothetical protein BMS9Abin29_0669 [Gemmatimonadota bacterium]
MVALSDPKRERLRVESFVLEGFQNGRCTARVKFGWERGVSYAGEADGIKTMEGELRAAAHATLQALGAATNGSLLLELVGVKAVRVFDTWVIIAAARGKNDGEALKLTGSFTCEEEEDVAKGAVLALMNATNRVLTGSLES